MSQIVTAHDFTVSERHLPYRPGEVFTAADADAGVNATTAKQSRFASRQLYGANTEGCEDDEVDMDVEMDREKEEAFEFDEDSEEEFFYPPGEVSNVKGAKASAADATKTGTTTRFSSLPLILGFSLKQSESSFAPYSPPKGAAQKKKEYSPRGVVLAPTHELARQLAGFAKDLPFPRYEAQGCSSSSSSSSNRLNCNVDPAYVHCTHLHNTPSHMHLARSTEVVYTPKRNRLAIRTPYRDVTHTVVAMRFLAPPVMPGIVSALKEEEEEFGRGARPTLV
ncbi:hypothetical protein CVT25_015207 [Psilocybe cyanescens]|uniref:Uncharacterized protein n=1 Tax=Psilocybe cyanescens TaxID=93625 RepID=A0A409WRQ1_PSICY|nr:hypothetical protein CVT25_015207 [Psilocybe cyanescens]